MSGTWYRAEIGGFAPTIKPVEVERETESSVWIAGRRNAKRSEWRNYFQTWDDAHALLMSDAAERVAEARKRLQHANDRLGNVKGMKRPEPQP